MRAILYILLAAFLAGCSTVKVNKITQENRLTAKGFRYSLPSRFVVVTPKDDGTVEVKVEHLPDEDLTFAVTGKTVFGKNTLNVTVANGLISILAFKPNSADNAAQLATSAGNVRNAELLADKAAATTATTARKALAKEVSDAALALEQAKAELVLAEKALAGQPEKLLTYQAKVASAELKLAELQGRLALLDAANDTSGVTGIAANTPRAYGPTIFRIVEDYSHPDKPILKLVVVEPPVSGGHFRVLDAGAVPVPVTDGPVVAGCPGLSEMIESIIYIRDEKVFRTLKFKPSVQVENVSVSRFNSPDQTVLSMENGRQRPETGVNAEPQEEFTVRGTVKVDGKDCPAEGNLTMPQ